MTASLSSKLHAHDPELELLLCCAAAHPDGPALNRAALILETQLNWDRLRYLAHCHGVAPLVYKTLHRHFVAASPDKVQIQLKDHAMANAQSNLALIAEVHAVHELLARHCINHAFFKGLMVTEQVYHDLSLRKCGDIDVLVDRADFARAKKLFVDQGFRRTLSDRDERLCLQSGLWHEGRRLMVDLHWGIPPLALGIPSGRLLHRARPLTIGGMPVPSFNDEDMLILLCINAVKEYWNQLLYPYCDIREYLAADGQIDWEHLRTRARQLRSLSAVQLALAMVATLFDAVPPECPPWLRVLPPRLQALHDELTMRILTDGPSGTRRPPYRVATHADYLNALRDGLAARLYHRHLSFMEPGDADRELLPLPHRLEFLYYIFRPLRLAGKCARRIAGLGP